jgi:hypothetical protein
LVWSHAHSSGAGAVSQTWSETAQAAAEPHRHSPWLEPQALESVAVQVQHVAPPVPHCGKVGPVTQWPDEPPSQHPVAQWPPTPQVQVLVPLPVQAWSASHAALTPQAQVPVVAPQPSARPAVWAAWQLQHETPPAPQWEMSLATQVVAVEQHPVHPLVVSQTQLEVPHRRPVPHSASPVFTLHSHAPVVALQESPVIGHGAQAFPPEPQLSLSRPRVRHTPFESQQPSEQLVVSHTQVAAAPTPRHRWPVAHGAPVLPQTQLPPAQRFTRLP